MKNIFQSTAPGKKPKRTVFDLSHEVKLSTEIGKLTPVFCEPTLPSDTWRLRDELFIRFSPMLAPVMHRMSAFFHWFFVPNRLSWQHWENFITGNDKAKVTPVYPRFRLPTITYNGLTLAQKYHYFGQGSLIDYLGFPTLTDENGNMLETISQDVYFDAIPIIDHYLIWYNFYRDENLDPDGIGNLNGIIGDVSSVDLEKFQTGDVNGVIDMVIPGANRSFPWQILFNNQWRAWEKDYFTSALPWPQKGPDVLIPGTSTGSTPTVTDYELQPKYGNDDDLRVSSSSGQVNISDIQVEVKGTGSTNKLMLGTPNEGISNLMAYQYNQNGQPVVDGQALPVTSLNGQGSFGGGFIPTKNVADALEIVPSSQPNALADGAIDEGTINNLRRAWDLQRFLEAEGRGGTRYPEWLRQIFAVFPGDYELQRPVFIGGSRVNIVISEVLQQSATAATPDDAVSPLGDYAGKAVAAGGSREFKYKFKEYGYVIGILSIRPRSGYMQGLPRKYQKIDRFDFGIHYFANLGEQEVKNSELFYNPNASDEVNDGTFGYQSRYAEYKFLPSRTCGDMRGNLDFWHLTRKFKNLPGLNKEFVYMQPNSNTRIFAVEEQIVADDTGNNLEKVNVDHLYCQVYIDLKAKRPLPRYGIPR